MLNWLPQVGSRTYPKSWQKSYSYSLRSSMQLRHTSPANPRCPQQSLHTALAGRTLQKSQNMPVGSPHHVHPGSTCTPCNPARRCMYHVKACRSSGLCSLSSSVANCGRAIGHLSGRGVCDIPSSQTCRIPIRIPSCSRSCGIAELANGKAPGWLPQSGARVPHWLPQQGTYLPS